MSIVVQKYGGSSVADAERIKGVASRIVKTHERGNQVVVVVSALGDTTDRLSELAHQVNPDPPEREMDMLLATGEQQSVALLAMAIESLGHRAISFTGLQVGIVTDSSHTRAKIVDVKSKRILEEIGRGRVVIVAGFQGVTLDNDITTLGRGGSDTTAVALAAKLGAQVCEIYTDVDGVYTADPRIVAEARRIPGISYEEMLEMSATGAKVMQLRSVEYARNYRVEIHVRSSFTEEAGTLIKEADDSMEKAIVTSVTHDTTEAKVTIFDVPDRPGVAAKVFGALADGNINIDMIIQNVSESGTTDISFTTAKADLVRARDIMDRLAAELGARGTSYDENIAKVSLIGAGMKTHPGVAARMFAALARDGINIQMISTSPIKIACVIDADGVDEAVRSLHTEFELGAVRS